MIKGLSVMNLWMSDNLTLIVSFFQSIVHDEHGHDVVDEVGGGKDHVMINVNKSVEHYVSMALWKSSPSNYARKNCKRTGCEFVTEIINSIGGNLVFFAECFSNVACSYYHLTCVKNCCEKCKSQKKVCVAHKGVRFFFQ